MSSGWSIRSRAKPYFAVWSKGRSLVASNELGIYEDCEVTVEFALYALPAQFDLNDFTELNSLLSVFVDHLVGIASSPILNVGVTPTGAIRIDMGATYSASTVNGIVQADGVFHELRVFTTLLGLESIWLDDVPVVFSQVGVPTVFSSAGASTAVMLFNDKDAHSLLDVAIRRARFHSFTSAELDLDYPIDEGHGTTVAPGPIVDPSGFLVLNNANSADLFASFYNPFSDLRYGPVPSSDPHVAFNWQLRTEYRRREKIPTDYRRRRTTWPV